MVTVHKMPLNNQFLTGINSGYDKISYQNEPKRITMLGITGDCQSVDYEKEGCKKPGTAFTGADIYNYFSTKPGVRLILWSRGFNSIKDNFEMETVENNKFLQLFTSYLKVKKEK